MKMSKKKKIIETIQLKLQETDLILKELLDILKAEHNLNKKTALQILKAFNDLLWFSYRTKHYKIYSKNNKNNSLLFLLKKDKFVFNKVGGIIIELFRHKNILTTSEIKRFLGKNIRNYFPKYKTDSKDINEIFLLFEECFISTTNNKTRKMLNPEISFNTNLDLTLFLYP